MPAKFDGSHLQQYLADELAKAFEGQRPVSEALQIARRAYAVHMSVAAAGRINAGPPDIPRQID